MDNLIISNNIYVSSSIIRFKFPLENKKQTRLNKIYDNNNFKDWFNYKKLKSLEMI